MRRQALKSTGRTRPKPRRQPAPDREFWQQQREALYARARGRCEHCGTSLDDSGMEAHHRKLRSAGGGHGLENLAALCPTSHKYMHEHPAHARMLGFIVSAYGDPSQRVVTLHDRSTVRLTADGSYDVIFDSNGRPAA